MVYICEKCLFTFKRVDFPEACPGCGSANLREATAEESAAFEEQQKKTTPPEKK